MADVKKSSSFWRRKALDIASLCFSDSLVLLIGLYLGNWIIFKIHGIPVSVHYALALIPVWCIGAVITQSVPAWGLGAVEELRRTQLLLLAVFALAGIAVFFGRTQFLSSRIVYLVSYLFSAIFIPLARIPVKKMLLAAGRWGCPTVLYGAVSQISGVLETFQKNEELGYIPCGIFTDDSVAGGQVLGVPVLGPLTGQTPDAAVAIVPVAFAEGPDFDKTLAGYQRVVLLPDIKEDVFLWAVPRTLGTLIGMEITSNLLNPFARIFKRGVDLFLTLLTAPLWLPLTVILSLLILLIDRQNPFFMQERIGKKNRLFHPVKFRTMVRNADQVLKETLAADEALRKEWEQNCKLRNDPRVTPLGKILRRTSLDELPQLFNVLAGQMALVGPRPLPDYHHEQLAESARAPRTRVRPGMTGLWQISGRSESGTAGMEKWDTYYVRNWSIWLDITILARTVASVISSKGAY
ncbi:MAG: exopolysaccharide biosynthesis polyprenyl glycosylphosphotransferase [Pontiellaceae bacterium]|jgi:Undecaprenyl-phosphate galactose phosphotransferase WbaP|nr:exopolysaccharide biosynthesis polyprenyl glycosylphosphotransferase [Pontiellaceae bacterium]